MYKQIWSENVKALLDSRGLTIAEAAEIIGTSRQYLSAILAEGEPQSAKEAIVDNLNWLLHANPGRFYQMPPRSDDYLCGRFESDEAAVFHLSPAETAILAEQNFRGGHYPRAHAVAEALLRISHGELVPAALAQAELLSGKSACLSGNPAVALPRLKSALSFYRKRLSAQPEKYFSLCLDSYRYLGLAYFLQSNYTKASNQLVAACRLAKQYPHLAVDVIPRLEEVVANLLRSASRQGSMSEVAQSASVVAAMAAACGLTGITHYVTLELALAQCPPLIVAGEAPYVDSILHSRIPALFRLSFAGYESLQGYTYLLILFLTGDRDGLESVFRTLSEETPTNQGAAAIAEMFLVLLQGRKPRLVPPASGVSEPKVFAALQRAGEAARLTGPETNRLQRHLWQEALGILREEREIPLYILTLHWCLRSTAQDNLLRASNIYRQLLEIACARWEGQKV